MMSGTMLFSSKIIKKLLNFNEHLNISDIFFVMPSLYEKSLEAGIGGI
jgi:hypothetical protein